jgi:hypothetical protein
MVQTGRAGSLKRQIMIFELHPALDLSQTAPVGGRVSMSSSAATRARRLAARRSAWAQPLHRCSTRVSHRLSTSAAGRSIPPGCTEETTGTRRGYRALRKRCSSACCFWRFLGATSLAYAGAYPQRVAAMVLRGVFLATRGGGLVIGGLGEVRGWR